MDITKQIEAKILESTTTPVSDFENLSAINFYDLLYHTYSENSIVRFQKNISEETLDKVSLFRVAEDYIRIIDREKSIKLTPLGALPKKVIIELYDKKYIYDYIIERGITKLTREQDCIAILNTKVVIELAGITKKIHGKLTLTKKGTSFLKPENRRAFFEIFISTFADKFNWGYNDSFTEKPIGQLGWTYTIYLLGKYGQGYQASSFYAEKYLTALPFLSGFLKTDGLLTNKDQFEHCYTIRSFERFMVWFGLVEFGDKSKGLLNLSTTIKATEILTEIFEIEIVR